MISRAEALFAAAVCTVAGTVLTAYTLDRAGFPFPPAAMLLLVLVAGAVAAARLSTGASADDHSLPVAAALLIATLGWVLWLARPAFLPAGSGPDLTHHLILIRYIEAHWRLVHDASVEEYLGEMTYYTPGSHVLVALAGAWLRRDGLQAFHPLIAVTVALKAVGVFLVARRLAAPGTPRVPLALLGALSLFAAPRFFVGSFIEYSFLAQVVAELFLVMMWWALTVWTQETWTGAVLIFGLCGAALFLTWPVLIGPPLLALGLLVLAERKMTFGKRLRDACIGALPIVAYALLFMSGRAAWLHLAGTGGETAHLSVDEYGWPLLLASAAGLVLCVVRPRGRATACVAVAFLTQSLALYWLAVGRGNEPYMALKLAYAFLFLQAAAVTMALSEAWWLIRASSPRALGRTAIPWLGAAVAAALAAWSVAGAPAALRLDYHPAVSRPVERAGKWAAANLPPACIEYLVPDVETAYWLHLAILGNPRISARTGNDDTYELNKTLVRWLTPGGLPYAIVDLPALPSDVRSELNIVQQFDTAAIARRRGPAACPAT